MNLGLGPKIIFHMTGSSLHDVLYTVYIVLCIFYYLDVLITKYGRPLMNWLRIDIAPRAEEPPVAIRTPEPMAVRRSTRRSTNQ